MTIDLLNANALHIPLADESVQMCMTSPPYWALRDYGVAGQLGNEATPEEYVADMVAVFREVRRVLRPDGVLWLNLGDSYAGSGGAGGDYNEGGLKAGQPRFEGTAKATRKSDTTSTVTGGPINYRADGKQMTGKAGGVLKPKDLCGIPWRVAFALQADGWWLRSDIIWHKPNPMPESVTDRPTKAHEYLFLLAKSAEYYYDAEAIKEPAQEWTGQAATFERESGKATELVAPGQSHPSHRPNRTPKEWTFDQDRRKQRVEASGGALTGGTGDKVSHGTTRNRRTVWTIPTSPYKGAHFATFPPALVEPCVLAGTSARGECPHCGKAWKRVTERVSAGKRYSTGKSQEKNSAGLATAFSGYDDGSSAPVFNTLGWRSQCSCPDHEPIPQIILDPFAGTATVGLVSVKLQRRFVGLELNPAYMELAKERLYGTQIQFVM